jgi:hypothetical protein
MLHIRRKAEIQNLNNVNATVGHLATCLDEAGQEDAELLAGLAAPLGNVPSTATPMFSTTPPSATSPALLPDLQVMQDSAPNSPLVKSDTKGLYAYVKTRILALLLPHL